MTTHRRYFFQHPGVYTEGKHPAIQALLEGMCAQYWWFNEPEVTGAPFDRLTFSFEVCGRDQWFCHKRAMWLAYRVLESLGWRETQLPEPMWETLPPHTNRGRYRVAPQ